MTGIPFSSKSRNIFEKALQAAELKREEIFATSCLKCSIEATKIIQERHFRICSDHLFRQLELIKPKVVCTMGPRTMKILLGNYKHKIPERNEDEEDYHGKPIMIKPRRTVFNKKKIFLPSFKFYLVPTYNPAIVDNYSIEKKIISDVITAKKLLDIKELLF